MKIYTYICKNNLMKKIFFLLIGIIMFLPSNAKIVYQGDANLGFGLGVGNTKIDKFFVRTTHGLRLNQYIFTGIGVGMDVGTNHLRSDIWDTEFNKPTSINIFFNIKGYYPLNQKIQFYLGGDLGYGNFSENGSEKISILEANTNYIFAYTGKGGIYFAPQIGINLKINNNIWFDAAIIYIGQRYKYDITIGEDQKYDNTSIGDFGLTSGSLGLKVGFKW